MDYEQPSTFPIKPGDWLVSPTERVARVRAVFWDKEVLADLVLYDNDGNRTGRESPILGGPRTFEPCCSIEGWQRIAKPDFPIKIQAVPTADGKSVTLRRWAGTRLPALQWTPRQYKGKGSIVRGNFDPELEIRSRLLSAQSLRDMARTLNVPQLVAEAIRLEKEAANLKARI